jgi:hypothetical protein
MSAPVCLAIVRLRAALREQKAATEAYCWTCTSWGFPSWEAKQAAADALVRIQKKVDAARALAWCAPADPSAIAERPSLLPSRREAVGLAVIPGGQARVVSLPDRLDRAAAEASRPGLLSGGDAA